MTISNSALAQKLDQVATGWQSFVVEQINYLTSEEATVTLTDPYDSTISVTVKTPTELARIIEALVEPAEGALATAEQHLEAVRQLVADAESSMAGINGQIDTVQTLLNDATAAANDAQAAAGQITNQVDQAVASAGSADTSRQAAEQAAANAETSATAAADSAHIAKTQRARSWYEGDGAPGVIEGVLEGDLYLNRLTGDVLKRLATSWSTPILNIKGPKGDKGDKGDTGATGADGSAIEASEILTRLRTVDGANSGLDADVLDGRHGDWYREWVNITGKPASYPPSSHGHQWSEISAKPDTALRWPTWNEVASKPTTVDGLGITDALTVRGGSMSLQGDAHMRLVSSGGRAYLQAGLPGEESGGTLYLTGWKGSKADEVYVYSNSFKINGYEAYHTGNLNTSTFVSTGIESQTIDGIKTFTRQPHVNVPPGNLAELYLDVDGLNTGGVFSNEGRAVLYSTSGYAQLRPSGRGSTDNALTVTADGVDWDGHLMLHTGNMAAQGVLLDRGELGSGGPDLDTLMTQGIYFQRMNAYATSAKHYPEGSAGCLRVFVSGNMTWQTYQLYNSGATYVRSYYNGAWYAWRKQLDSLNGDVEVGNLTTTGNIAAAGSVTSGNYLYATHGRLYLNGAGDAHIMGTGNGGITLRPNGWSTTGQTYIRSSGAISFGGDLSGPGTGQISVVTDYGYVNIGPANTGYCHFSTDRPRFYFSKNVTVDGDIEHYNGPRVPRTFVQSGDPGSSASTGDLWIW